MMRKRADFRLDGAENARDLLDWTIEVFCRAHPKRNLRHTEVHAPIEHIVELLRSQGINRVRVMHAVSLAVATVAIDDNADVARDRVASNLTDEPVLI